MSGIGTGVPERRPSAFAAIFWGGLACGVFDITQAFIAWGFEGARPFRILQGIAVGLLGPKSFQGGWPTAVLGLACHFLIAFSAAAIYYAASRGLRFMTQHAVISGLLYGEIVFFVMNYVVIPLSRAHRRPWSDWAFIITGLIGHPLLVGLPIALAVRHFAGEPESKS
jgi:hypothetical protein